MVEKLRPMLEQLPSDSGANHDQYQEMVRKISPGQYKIETNYF